MKNNFENYHVEYSNGEWTNDGMRFRRGVWIIEPFNTFTYVGETLGM